MHDQIKPEDAPKDGQRVMFYFPDGTGTEDMVSAVYDQSREEWFTRDGAVLDLSKAVAAHVMGRDS